MLFFVDPVAYLVQEVGDGLDQVLFVMPSEGGGPPFETDPIFPPSPREGPEDREKDEGPGEWASLDELDVSGGRGSRRVKKLQPGKSIPVFQGVWEFIPYNDPTTRPADPQGFGSIVDGHRKVLLNGDDDARKDALSKLRSHYEAIFGRSAMNDVS